MDKFSQTSLRAFLDEALDAPQMAAIETALRDDPALVEKLAALVAERDAGLHSLGEIWRRGRLTCPTREQLGSYLLGALPDDVADYVTFHVENIACRTCGANLADLKSQAEASSARPTEQRRQKYFQSSVGRLRR
jgi:hypothetical protein